MAGSADWIMNIPFGEPDLVSVVQISPLKTAANQILYQSQRVCENSGLSDFFYFFTSSVLLNL